jgi:hypothetical protein
MKSLRLTIVVVLPFFLRRRVDMKATREYLQNENSQGTGTKSQSTTSQGVGAVAVVGWAGSGSRAISKRLAK